MSNVGQSQLTYLSICFNLFIGLYNVCISFEVCSKLPLKGLSNYVWCYKPFKSFLWCSVDPIIVVLSYWKAANLQLEGRDVTKLTLIYLLFVDCAKSYFMSRCIMFCWFPDCFFMAEPTLKMCHLQKDSICKLNTPKIQLQIICVVSFRASVS